MGKPDDPGEQPIPEDSGSNRDAEGKFKPGHSGNPNGRPKKQSPQERFFKEFGKHGEQELFRALAQAIMERLEGPNKDLATDSDVEWLLKRIWPVPTKIEAEVEHSEREAPVIPTEEERRREVAKILWGEEDAEPNTPGTDTVQ